MPFPRFPCSLCFALVVISSLLPASTAVVSNRVVAGQLVLYTFQEGQFNINASATRDQSQQNLLPALNLPSLSSAWSAERQGLTLTGQFDNSSVPSLSLIQSSTIVSYFKVNLQSSFSVEAFLSPASLVQRGVVLGFGSWNASRADGGCQGGATGWRDWFWYQNGSSLTTTLSHAGSAPGCTSVSVPLSASAAVHHVVTSVAMIGSIGTANVTCYYNGQLVLSKLIAQTSFQGWQGSNYLQLSSGRLSSPASPAATWQGSVYLFAMYSPALSASGVATNYQSNLPNSAPVLASLAQSATLLQNSTLTPLASLAFNASDFDGDAILYRLVMAPAKGQLVLYDPPSNTTTQLSSGEVFYLSSPQEQFWYAPVAGEWGAAYAQFTFAACDTSECGVPALVTLNVQHIVTPPVSVNAAVSLLSGASVVVQLVGLDVDAQPPLHSNMTSATLLSLPVNGLLFAWNGTTASPAAPLNTSSPLTLLASASPQCPLCVLYVPTTALSATNGGAYNDSFAFVVAVRNTTSAANATVALSVNNPLTAQPVAATLLGDAPLYFALRGASALHAAFSYVVLSLPQKGNLTLQSGQAVSVYAAGGGGGSGNVSGGGVVQWATSQMRFSSAVSVYAGRYNASLDPVSDSFAYSLVDADGNQAAPTPVTILYPPIHHAPAILTDFIPDLFVNATAPSQDASQWTVVAFAIVDDDAAPGSAFLAANPSCPFSYNVVVSVAPVVGAVVRLDPQRTVIVQVVSGLATGSTQLAFTCGYAACNAVLAGLQLQANAANAYNLSIAVTQVDTGIVTRSSSTITAESDAASASTGSAAPSPSSSPSNNDSLSSLLAPSSKWFWVLIACCVGVLVLACLGWKWRRTQRAQKARKQEITSVAVELAKAVGSDKKEATADIEARAERRTLDTIAQFQALSSPRMQMAVDPASFAQTQGMPYLQSPMAGMGMGMAMSPRGGMGGAGMFGVMPMSPSASQLSMRASPRSVNLGVVEGGDELAAQQQWYAQQQQQLAQYQQHMAASPRLALPNFASSGAFLSLSPRANAFSSTQPLPAVPSPRQAAAPPAVPPRRFSFAVPRSPAAAAVREQDKPGHLAEGLRPRLSLMVTPAEQDEPPIMPHMSDLIE